MFGSIAGPGTAEGIFSIGSSCAGGASAGLEGVTDDEPGTTIGARPGPEIEPDEIEPDEIEPDEIVPDDIGAGAITPGDP